MIKYYNNVGLPNLPSEISLEEFPYVWIRKNESAGYYDLAFSNVTYYYSSSRMYVTGSTQYWYRISLDTVIDENTEWDFYRTYDSDSDYWGISSTQIIVWTSFNVPNGSATSTTIYYKGSEPVDYHYSCATTNLTGTSLTCEVDAKSGEWILATVTTRSATTLPDDWELLRESTVLSSDASSQRMFILCKQALESGTQSISITQETDARIYINLIVMPNIKGFLYHEGYESYANVDSMNILIERPIYDSIVWCCTANLWKTSAPYGAWVCDDLVPICLDQTSFQPRQANFIDLDTEISQRTFSPATTSDGSPYIIDFVEIVTYTRKYLVRSEGDIYTIVEGVLTKLEATEVTALLFQENGLDSIPESNYYLDLVDPEILLWQESELYEPTLKAKVTATPLPQSIISDKVDIAHQTITGIENMVATCESDLIIAVSFDDKATWKAWNGEQWATLSEDFTGMNKETLEAITYEQWNELFAGADGFYIRVSFIDTTQSVTEIYVDFSN